jgi:hypothetical protein
MKRIRHVRIASLLGLAALLNGCVNTDNGPAGPSTDDSQDESAIQGSLDGDIPGYADPDVFLYGSDALTGTGRAEVLRWWRELQNVDTTVEIILSRPSEGPKTASVKITKDLSGILHVLEGEGDAATEFEKKFEDTAIRSLYFERRGPALVHPRRGWKLKALSGALVESPGTTRQIHSVTVHCDGVDKVITNVTDLVRIGELLRLPADSEVTVTVDTGDATDAVFLHIRRNHMRFPLLSNGNGTFSGTFVANRREGPHHVVVDVLSDATLHDKTAAYDNVAWGIPYLVLGEDDGLDDDGNDGN